MADKSSQPSEGENKIKTVKKTTIRTRQIVGAIVIGFIFSAIIVRYTSIIGLNSTSVNATTTNIATASGALNATLMANAALIQMLL